jgi:flagellar M-ring protein FliF
LQYVQQLEQLYTSRIMSILEPVVGQGNVKAQVTAEVDFSQTESTSELHKPNQGGEPGAVRSQQMVEVGPGSTGSNASGVPGATTNQPAAAASAPVNGAAPALSAAGGSAVGAGSKRESVVNYEVDKTVKVVRGASGVVKRLSAAVVVNYKPTTEGAGKIVPKALSDQQVEQMTALVRESIGYSKERGDSVNLMNAPFAVEQSKVVEVPWWKQPDVQDTARSLAWPVSTLLLVTLILLGVVRPSIKAVNQARQAPPASNQLSAVVSDEPERPQLLANDAELVPAAPSREQLMLADARQLAKENPVAVANIVKHWVSGESAS